MGLHKTTRAPFNKEQSLVAEYFGLVWWRGLHKNMQEFPQDIVGVAHQISVRIWRDEPAACVLLDSPVNTDSPYDLRALFTGTLDGDPFHGEPNVPTTYWQGREVRQ